MLRFRKPVNIAAIISVFLLLSVSPVEANSPNLVNFKPKTITSDLKSSRDIYKQAKEELPGDWYPLYRIVERIARANELDDRPWRITIISEPQINAFATEVNLIAMYNGFLDQLAGDSSALACLVSHEMAHHVEEHIAMSPVEQAQLRQNIREEALVQVTNELEDSKHNLTGTALEGVFTNFLGSMFGASGARIARIMCDSSARNRLNPSQGNSLKD